MTAAIERAAQSFRDAELHRHVNAKPRVSDRVTDNDDGTYSIKLPIGFAFVTVSFTRNAPWNEVFILGAELDDGFADITYFADKVRHAWLVAIEKEFA